MLVKRVIGIIIFYHNSCMCLTMLSLLNVSFIFIFQDKLLKKKRSELVYIDPFSEENLSEDVSATHPSKSSPSRYSIV